MLMNKKTRYLTLIKWQNLEDLLCVTEEKHAQQTCSLLAYSHSVHTAFYITRGLMLVDVPTKNFSFFY